MLRYLAILYNSANSDRYFNRKGNIMKKQPNWYGLDMLPVYLKISREQLQDTMKQLQNLENCRHKPYLLDDHTVDRIIKIHSEQSESTWVLLEQCKKWRQLSLNQQQLTEVTETEENVENLNKANKKVLALAEHFKHHTINSILEKDDIDLAVDFLTNNKQL
jgi:hypothetical protein